MGAKKKSNQENSENMSPVEALRITRTELTREQFVVYCGFGRGSYYRWITGKTSGKITLLQLKQMARLLKIERIDELPDHFSPSLRSQPSDPAGNEEE